MASFMDMINQGLGNLNTPLGMLGTNMLANSGFQPGATAGSRLGNSVQGMAQQQAQMQQLQMQAQLRQQQQQEVMLRQQAMQKQQEQSAKLAEAMQANPDMAKQLGPLGSAVLQAGGDPADALGFGKLQAGAGPQMAKMPWSKAVPNEDGTTTSYEYDLNTGGYKPVSTYKTPTMMNAEANVAKTGQQMEIAPQQLELERQRANATGSNAEVAQQRLQLEQEKQQKEMASAAFKKQFDRLEFKQQSRAAVTAIDDVATLADEVANSPALNRLYGPNGYIPPIAGTDAADLQAKIDRLRAKGGLTELVNLKQQGVALTPVSNTDLLTAQTSFANFDKLQSDSSAKAEFQRAAAVLRRAKEEAQTRATEYDSLFDTPSAGTKAASGPATISDDAGYNALPSGAQFIAPDGTLRRKP